MTTVSYSGRVISRITWGAFLFFYYPHHFPHEYSPYSKIGAPKNWPIFQNRQNLGGSIFSILLYASFVTMILGFVARNLKKWSNEPLLMTVWSQWLSHITTKIKGIYKGRIVSQKHIQNYVLGAAQADCLKQNIATWPYQLGPQDLTTQNLPPLHWHKNEVLVVILVRNWLY